MPLKMLVPGQGASPQSSFRGAAGRGYRQEGHLRQLAHSTSLPSSPFSLECGREIKPQAFHAERHHHQGGASLPPMPAPLAPDPGPGAASAVTLRPVQNWDGTAAGVSPEPSTTNPLPGGVVPSKGWRQGPETGCSSASCPRVSWMPSQQAALGRKVAQLARQVCLSSNRTQEEAQGVLTPSCWPGRPHLQRWEACLQAVPRRCTSRAKPEPVWAARSHPAVS